MHLRQDELHAVHPALRPLVCVAWLLGDDVPEGVKRLGPEHVLAAREALGLHADDPDPAFHEHTCGGHVQARRG